MPPKPVGPPKRIQGGGVRHHTLTAAGTPCSGVASLCLRRRARAEVDGGD